MDTVSSKSVKRKILKQFWKPQPKTNLKDFNYKLSVHWPTLNLFTLGLSTASFYFPIFDKSIKILILFRIKDIILHKGKPLRSELCNFSQSSSVCHSLIDSQDCSFWLLIDIDPQLNNWKPYLTLTLPFLQSP